MTGNEILQKALQDKENIIAHRRFLHSRPEIGFDLKDTTAYVQKKLTEMGYSVQPCGKSGIVVCAGGKKPGKVFLIRADMDALPIKEETSVEYASSNGNMHACGHDMHTAMLLGAAQILKDLEPGICGTVKLMFQPAEELLAGARDMLEAGVLKNPDVDAGLMMHVMTGMPFPAGTAIVTSGGISAPAADYFTINIQGKGCHGAMPYKGVDPINVASHVVLALQEISARELAYEDDAALTIGSFQAGSASNIIPDTATLRGTLRAYDEEIRNHIKNRMTEIVSHTAAAFRAKATVTYDAGCPTLQNDESLSSNILQYARELLGENMALSTAQLSDPSGGNPSKSSGSEDFAYISHEIPTVMIALSATPTGDTPHYPLHHPQVTFDENALPYGAAIYAYTALRFLEDRK